MSKFQELKDELQQYACQTCLGTGSVDDAEPGDICYNTVVCPDCHGTGILLGLELELHAVKR